MSCDFSIIEEEDSYEKAKTEFGIPRPGLRPTEASVEFVVNGKKIVIGKCMREAWYRSMNIPVVGDKNVGLQMKAYLGKWGEVGIIERWKEMGIWTANNIKFYNKEFALSGELDAIIQPKNQPNNVLIGYEIKSFYNYAAGRTICGVKREKGSGKFMAGRPKDEHFLQASLYAWEYKNVLSEYRLYYFERGDGHRVEFEVGTDKLDDGTHRCWWRQIPGKYWNAFKEEKVYQPYTIEDIYARYKVLLTKLRAKELPPKDYTDEWDAATVEYMYSTGELSDTKYKDWTKDPSKHKLGDWACSYCQYQDQCKQDEINK